MKPHKHSELIKKWADGHTIQIKMTFGDWVDITQPEWLLFAEYRASICEIEGKPVFVGDILYDSIVDKFFRVASVTFDGNLVKIKRDLQTGNEYALTSRCSWTRPKPKSILDSIEYRELMYFTTKNPASAVLIENFIKTNFKEK